MIICIIGTILVGMPFIIEDILFDAKHIPFNTQIKFSREVWFGFIASYLGAVGTVLLGIIALYQNKRYKKLSDESEKRFIELQAEIKELNKRNVELIEINTKIEKAKYYPQLSEQKHYYWNISGENLEENFNMDNGFQITIKKEDDFNSSDRLLNEIFDKYYTFTYVLKNEGEKTIRNFNCKNLKINSKHGMGFWVYYPCDIEPGKLMYVVYATKINMHEKVKKGELNTINFEYSMENVIGEKFSMEVYIEFYDTGEDVISTRLETNGIMRE